ncbi:MAG: hypothetical protein AABZ47_17215 [Planctomycetota bacterium]
MSPFRHEDIDPQLERRIARHLDGELSTDEDLAFQRDILREENARGLLEDYRKIDDLVSLALTEVTTGRDLRPGTTLWNSAATSAARRKRSFSRAWWVIPGAIAAAMAWFMAGPLPTEQAPQNARIALTGRPGAPPNSMSLGGTLGEVDGRLVRPVSTGRRTIRDIDRDLVGVLGDDGNIYWFEVNRTRTLRGADGDSNIRLAAGDW